MEFGSNDRRYNHFDYISVTKDKMTFNLYRYLRIVFRQGFNYYVILFSLLSIVHQFTEYIYKHTILTDNLPDLHINRQYKFQKLKIMTKGYRLQLKRYYLNELDYTNCILQIIKQHVLPNEVTQRKRPQIKPNNGNKPRLVTIQSAIYAKVTLEDFTTSQQLYNDRDSHTSSIHDYITKY